MARIMSIVFSYAILICSLTSTPAQTKASGAQIYDIVISHGRVIDPETRLDAVRNIGIKDGKIEAISTSALKGRIMLDAAGLIVAPGFIDWHSHGQSTLADRMQAFDGVTTTLELEAGMLPIGRWYELQAKSNRVLNYGASSSWAIARMATLENMPLPSEPRAAALFANFSLKRWPERCCD
jgi:predicted amidohydrolase